MSDYLASDEFVHDFQNADEKSFTKAFDALFKDYFKKLYAFSYGITGNEGESEDRVIEALAALYIKRGDFDNLPNIRAFLYMAVRNSSLNYIRYTQRKTQREKEFQRQTDQDPELTNAQIQAEVMETLYGAIEQLPAQCQKVCKLLFIDGLKYDEAADTLGLSVNTIKAQRTIGVRSIKFLLSAVQVIGLVLPLPLFF